MRYRKLLLTNSLTHAIKMPLTLQVIHAALFASSWQFYSNDENAWRKKNKDFTIYAEKSTSAAKKEMLGILIGTNDKE